MLVVESSELRAKLKRRSGGNESEREIPVFLSYSYCPIFGVLISSQKSVPLHIEWKSYFFGIIYKYLFHVQFFVTCLKKIIHNILHNYYIVVIVLYTNCCKQITQLNCIIDKTIKNNKNIYYYQDLLIEYLIR